MALWWGEMVGTARSNPGPLRSACCVGVVYSGGQCKAAAPSEAAAGRHHLPDRGAHHGLARHLAWSLVLAASCCHTLVSAGSVPDTSARYALPSLPSGGGSLTARRSSAGCTWRDR